MNNLKTGLMALFLSATFATAVQAQRPERPSHRPTSGMSGADRPKPKKGGSMAMPTDGIKEKRGGMKGMGMPDAKGPRGDKGQRPAGGKGQRPAGGKGHKGQM